MLSIISRVGSMAAWTAVFSLITVAARAGQITIPLGTTGYQITYDDNKANVDVTEISYPKGRGNFQTIIETVTFLTNDPFVIKFSETKAATTTSGTGVGPKFCARRSPDQRHQGRMDRLHGDAPGP